MYIFTTSSSVTESRMKHTLSASSSTVVLRDESHRGGAHVELQNQVTCHRAYAAMASSARDHRQRATSVSPLASARSQHAQVTECVRACVTRSTKRPSVMTTVTAHRSSLASCHISRDSDSRRRNRRVHAATNAIDIEI